MPHFIRGNRDGPNRRNLTYTICRFDVTPQQLKTEIRQGLHAESLVNKSPEPWPCPALAWAQFAHPDPKLPRLAGLSPASVPDEEKVRVLRKEPGQIHGFTICRLGVTKARLSEEILADLHPGYMVGFNGPQGIGSGEVPDNINHPGPRCPLRLIPRR